MTLADRLQPDPRHLPDNIIRLDARPERRAPQRWWERAQAGELYGRDEKGVGRIVVGRGGEAA